jgi:Tfp pilus assembly protein PilF/KaiC/GvpD/RAD55 family RecA-like ATPase
MNNYINRKIIFDFDFVDRVDERKQIDEFSAQPSQNILWVNGDSGIGKTFFIEKYICSKYESNDYKIVYINKAINEENKVYLDEFINELSKICDRPIIKFIKENYKAIIDVSENVAQKLPSDPLGLTSIFFNVAKLFISIKENDSSHSSEALISKYIDSILSSQKLLIVLDNFMFVDEDSLTILEKILMKFNGNEKITFIIVTTSERLEETTSVKAFLCDKLTHELLQIKAFSNEYFNEILMDKFNVDDSIKNYGIQLYDLCSGNLIKLKEFLRTLYLNQGIKIENEVAYFIKQKFEQLLYKGFLNFNYDDLAQSQKLIVKTLAHFLRPIPAKIIIDFINYMSSTNDFEYEFVLKQGADRIIMELSDLDVIVHSHTSLASQLSFSHDTIFAALNKFFSSEDNSVSTAYLHNKIYRFMMEYHNIFVEHGFTEEDILYMKADQSYYGCDGDWIYINTKLAYDLREQGKHHSANNVFSRLRYRVPQLSNNIKLAMADTFYEIGNYENSFQVLNEISPDDLPEEDASILHLSKGRIISFTNSERAIIEYDMALPSANKNLELKILYLKEMALTEIQGGREKAEEIFFGILEKFADSESVDYISVLRSSVNIFDDGSSMKYLIEAEEKASFAKNDLELGKILNNKGYEYTRTEDYMEATDCFERSCNLLGNVKVHESAYPLVNVAFIQMHNKQWECALSYLSRAEYWNTTTFLPYVIKTYRMICLLNMGKTYQARLLKEELLSIIDEVHDYKMKRKILINCAIVAQRQGDVESAKHLLQRSEVYISEESKKRFLRICQNLGYDSSIKLMANYNYEGNRDKYIGIDFEPWMVTFGHD